MMVFTMLLGILLSILGISSASPVATVTTSDNATSVVVGPRRNGYSDLPSSVLAYNANQYWNSIPNFVTVSDPENGNDALIYNRDEIYYALQEGYEALQRTRDPVPAQRLSYANILYPVHINRQDMGLPQTYLGRYGLDDSVPMYMWPLIWTNGWTGHNQNPGTDRIVFDDNGVYLGVITRIPSNRSPEGDYRWCPPTTITAEWDTHWTGLPNGWAHSGVPPGGPQHWWQPALYLVAQYNLAWWWEMNGMPPYGNHDIQINSSSPPPANMKPSGAQYDNDDPLDFPPLDNSTGVWHVYEPGNDTTDLSNESVPSDCKLAHDHGAGAYQQNCHTQWTRGTRSMKVRVTISGTGQNNHGWCKGIIQNMHTKCGGNFNLAEGQYACDERYPGTATFSKAVDKKDSEYGKYYFGIDMHFYMTWPWATKDADHACMAEAVERASCAGALVKSQNGKWCRNIYWVPDDPPLLEWSSDLGPA